MDTVIKAFGLVFQFDVMVAVVASAFYGLTVGALPGLSATMATALLVPVTFYLSPIKAIAAMLLGLQITCIGIDNPGGVPRFTFGSTDLLGGIEVIPALVGVFALAEVMRSLTERDPPKIENRKLGSILRGNGS